MKKFCVSLKEHSTEIIATANKEREKIIQETKYPSHM